MVRMVRLDGAGGCAYMVRVVRINGTHGTLEWYAWYAGKVRMGMPILCGERGRGGTHGMHLWRGGVAPRVNGTCRSMDVSNVKVNEEHYGTRGMVYGIQ